VLEEPRRKVLQQGRLQSRQHIASEYPEVDFGKLNPIQYQEIEAEIAQVKALQKETISLKKKGFVHAKNVYEAQRKCIEMQEFYEDCLKSCSKEIVRIHESN